MFGAYQSGSQIQKFDAKGQTWEREMPFEIFHKLEMFGVDSILRKSSTCQRLKCSKKRTAPEVLEAYRGTSTVSKW